MSGVLNVLVASGGHPPIDTGGGGPFNDIGGNLTISFSANGTAAINDSGGNVQTWDWVTPTSLAPGDWEIRCTVNSGTVSGGSATGSWLALSSNHNWQWNSGDDGNVTIEIRDALGVVRASDTYDMNT